MLNLKLKPFLLVQGKKYPQTWVQKYCHLTYAKANNLVNNKQKSIAFVDLSWLCCELQCTPNDLFWWDNSSKIKVAETHPCITKLIKPQKDANWTVKIESLDAERAELLRQQLELLLTEKHNETAAVLLDLKNKEPIENISNLEEIDSNRGLN